MVLGMFGKALPPVPKSCYFSRSSQSHHHPYPNSKLLQKGMVEVERVPDPCGQGAVDSRVSFGRPPHCPSCQAFGKEAKIPTGQEPTGIALCTLRSGK